MKFLPVKHFIHIFREVICFQLARRVPGIVVLFMLFALANSSSLSHADSPPREYQLKAAFLYTFIKFVEWPDTGTSGTSRPLCLAVLGQDPFGSDLDALKGKSVKGRTIMIKRFRKVEEARDCDILFISGSEKKQLPRILKQLQGAPLLTVGDHEGFCEAGGMINLITTQNKISFAINVAATHRAQLHISSQLMKLAKTVIE